MKMLAAALLIALAHSPVLFYSFAQHDQYRYFRVDQSEKGSCFADTQYQGLYYDLGRPIAAEIECAVFKSVQNLSDLTPFRMLAIAIIVATAALFMLGLQRLFKLSDTTSAVLAVLVFTLPGLQNVVVMSNFPALLGVTMATAAYFILEWGWRRESMFLRILTFLTAFLIFFAALFTYPAAAFSFFAFTALKLMLTPKQSGMFFRSLARDLCLTGVASILFWITVKRYLHPAVNYPDQPGSGTYSFAMTKNLSARAFFFQDFSVAALNLWNIYSSLAVALIFSLAIAFGLWKWKRKEGFKKIALVLLAVMAVNTPLLISNYDNVAFRTLVGYQMVLLFLCAWILDFRPPKWVAAMLVAVAIGSCGFNVAMNGKNASMEFAKLTQALKEKWPPYGRAFAVANVERDYAVRGINGLRSIGDEFNVNSTVYSIHELIFLVRLAAVESGAPRNLFIQPCKGAGCVDYAKTCPFPCLVVMKVGPQDVYHYLGDETPVDFSKDSL